MTIIFVLLSGLVGAIGGYALAKRQSSPHADYTSAEVDDQLAEARGAVAERTEKRLARIMQAAQQSKRITNDQVEDLFCISDRTASSYLRTLTARQKLTRHGRGRGTYYTPN